MVQERNHKSVTKPHNGRAAHLITTAPFSVLPQVHRSGHCASLYESRRRSPWCGSVGFAPGASLALYQDRGLQRQLVLNLCTFGDYISQTRLFLATTEMDQVGASSSTN
jgi:hypothetical protein